VFRDREGAGVLIHAIGHQGKSSLAARIANRMPSHHTVVVFERYDALAVFEALLSALPPRLRSDFDRTWRCAFAAMRLTARSTPRLPMHRSGRRTGKPFGQIILAAADVDADVFRQLCAAYAEVASRTTLYVSKRDRAVEASRWLHHFARAGVMPPTLVVPGIDTINVTNVDLTMLGHGYIA